jgi:hypothetical protein
MYACALFTQCRPSADLRCSSMCTGMRQRLLCEHTWAERVPRLPSRYTDVCLKMCVSQSRVIVTNNIHLHAALWFQASTPPCPVQSNALNVAPASSIVSWADPIASRALRDRTTRPMHNSLVRSAVYVAHSFAAALRAGVWLTPFHIENVLMSSVLVVISPEVIRILQALPHAHHVSVDTHRTWAGRPRVWDATWVLPRRTLGRFVLSVCETPHAYVPCSYRLILQ